ncbi:MAG TPA: response regulator transcription factor [Opitutaceae bacterium]
MTTNSSLPPAIRILVVDDHPTFVMELHALVSAQPDMEVVAQAESGEQAVELYRQWQPEILLMDLRLPGISGTEAMSQIRGEFPESRVIIVSAYDWEEDIHRAMRGGARAFLLKDSTTEDIAATIRAVSRGDTAWPELVARRLMERSRREPLTKRELEVLQKVIKGWTNKEIAAALCIAENTVRTHLKAMFSKLRVHDRTEAAVCAIRYGIVHLD